MKNPPVDFSAGARKLTRWLRIFKTRTKRSKTSAGTQAIGVFLVGIAAASLALLVVALVFVLIITPNFPASGSSLAKSEGAANLTTTALRNFLPGRDVRVERLFAYNLKLYVDRKPFEDIPYPDRTAMMAKIGRLWCDNIGFQWFARVSVFDIRSGKKLSTHTCALGKLRGVFLN